MPRETTASKSVVSSDTILWLMHSRYDNPDGNVPQIPVGQLFQVMVVLHDETADRVSSSWVSVTDS
jgi:hypothetical protein